MEIAFWAGFMLTRQGTYAVSAGTHLETNISSEELAHLLSRSFRAPEQLYSPV